MRSDRIIPPNEVAERLSARALTMAAAELRRLKRQNRNHPLTGIDLVTHVTAPETLRVPAAGSSALAHLIERGILELITTGNLMVGEYRQGHPPRALRELCIPEKVVLIPPRHAPI